MRRRFRRQARRRTPARQALTEFPAPTAGWISNRNIAQNTRNAARVMEDWFPQQESVRVRKGWLVTYAFANDVTTLFTYDDGVKAELFAISGADIWEIAGGGATAATGTLTFLSTDKVDTAQIVTAGGAYLYVTTGRAAPHIYDGSTWQVVGSATSPIALTGVDVTKLIYPFVFKERLFFVEKDSLKVWFLAVKSVGGALSDLDLSSVFRRGGELILAGSVSSDSGSGFDDRCAFITSQGEVAIYQGTDPADANAWQLVGVYEIGAPLGRKAWIRAGGDWVIATREGMVPLSAAINRDPAALSVAAVSRQIEPDWIAEASRRTDQDWECAKWDAGNLAMIAMPVDTPSGTNPAQVFVVNVETGAWCKWTGLNVEHLTTYDGKLYAAAGSTVYEAEGASSDGFITGGDPVTSYTARLSWWPDDLGSTAAHKRAALGRATFLADTTFTPKLSVSVNYDVSWPTPPSASAGLGGGVWDASFWGSALWAPAGAQDRVTRWVSLGRSGYSIAPQVQITIGGGEVPDINLVAFDLVSEAGGVVV